MRKLLFKFVCWMGWHGLPGWSPWEDTSFDGASTHARCRLCGFTGMIDSQGNLF